MAVYSEIHKIEDPKQRMFACMDRIKELKEFGGLIPLGYEDKLELDNLEVLKMNSWSEWKD